MSKNVLSQAKFREKQSEPRNVRNPSRRHTILLFVLLPPVSYEHFFPSAICICCICVWRRHWSHSVRFGIQIPRTLNQPPNYGRRGGRSLVPSDLRLTTYDSHLPMTTATLASLLFFICVLNKRMYLLLKFA